MEIFFIMLPAFCECLVLVGIHSYLGLHVIKRKVIFVDLALAQIAAMGTTIAFLFGIAPSSHSAYWFSLVLTAVGALIFSLCRAKNDKIPQEAVIGLVYALSAAAGILIIDKAPEGASHLKHMLIGSILWVKWETIIEAAIIYALLGMFHYIFRRKFILISENPEKAFAAGVHVHFWDFLFYLSFGIIITHSVGTAGVLLVFVFLVAPAIMALMITDRWLWQLVIGWTMGFIVSALGLWISYVADLSTGPAVITIYGLVLLVMVTLWHHIKAKDHWQALRQTCTIVCLFGVLFAILFAMGKFLRPSPEQHVPENSAAAKAVGGDLDISKEVARLQAMEESSLQSYFQELSDITTLQKLFTHVEDQQIQTAIILRVLALSPVEGGKMVLVFLQSEPPEYFVTSLLQPIKNCCNISLDMGKSLKEQQHLLREWINKSERKAQ